MAAAAGANSQGEVRELTKRYVVTVSTKDKRLADAVFKFFTGDDKPEDADVRMDVVQRGVMERVK